MNPKKWNKLLLAAKGGDADAQYNVGNYYEDGYRLDKQRVIEEDKKKAYSWYVLAHKGGNINATVRVADFLSDGIVCGKDLERAIELYRKAIAEGIGYAAINLATVYRDKGDLKAAFELYQTAQTIDKSNLIELAFCYHFGIGTDKDRLKAFNIFQKIAGDVSDFRNCEYEIDEANYYLGLYYLEGEVVTQSNEKASHFFNIANKDGDHRSADELYLMLKSLSL